MKGSKDNKYTLLDHEKRFLELYGKVFELRRSHNFGRIFALLSLKANTEGKGLDQQEIVKYINMNFKDSKNSKDIISVSTVSRALTKMEKSKYCSSTPSSGKGGRKYFCEVGFSKLVLDRIEVNVREGENLVQQLDNLKKGISPDDHEKFKDFINHIDNLKQVYQVVSQYYDDLFQKISAEISKIDYK
ncbi:MAG: hypothetical protein ACXAC2_13825 [Candidatus Kariarchaeaceae archaeon]|jgi:DNA-binding transcriptional regulator GbsR (MarR family)